MPKPFELWDRARELYAMARATLDPIAKSQLLGTADGYLRWADEIRKAMADKETRPDVADALPR
jgi:hypothetical protein